MSNLGQMNDLQGSHSGQLLVRLTGKVFLERGQEVFDDWHAPGLADQPVARSATHVGNVGVVLREAENPAQPPK